MGEPRPLAPRLWGAYLLLLALSTGVRWLRERPMELASGQHSVIVPEMRGWDSTAGRVEIAYREAGPADAPRLLVLHGSPGSGADVWPVASLLADSFHVIAPDLPGFGRSTQPSGMPITLPVTLRRRAP